jgi:cysteine desulfurase
MTTLIYLDHAASTPVAPEAVEAMLPYLSTFYGNPSGVHGQSRACKAALEEAREKTAYLLGAGSPSEILFTSGGSESDNLAIKGLALALQHKGRHIITTQIEHHAVLNTCRYLEEIGFEVTYLPVTGEGLVDLEVLSKTVRPDTILVSVIAASNEVGTIQPVKEIAALLRERRILFHTDAVQAVGNIPFEVSKLGVDAASMSAHKFYGPKGTGVLYLRKSLAVHSLIHGGSQEGNRRAGTENIAGIVGLAKALDLVLADLSRRMTRVRELRDHLTASILSEVEGAIQTGHCRERLPNHASFCFENVDGHSLVMALDMEGIACSSGASCASGSAEMSYVLKAMGVPPSFGTGSLRLTLGRGTTDKEIDQAALAVLQAVKRMRSLGPPPAHS